MTYRSIGYKRRQYEDIARLLGLTWLVFDGDPKVKLVMENLTNQFAVLFTNDNGRFDRARFERAVEDWKNGRRA